MAVAWRGFCFVWSGRSSEGSWWVAACLQHAGSCLHPHSSAAAAPAAPGQGSEELPHPSTEAEPPALPHQSSSVHHFLPMAALQSLEMEVSLPGSLVRHFPSPAPGCLPAAGEGGLGAETLSPRAAEPGRSWTVTREPRGPRGLFTGKVILEWGEEVPDDRDAPGPLQQLLASAAADAGDLGVVEGEAEDPGAEAEEGWLRLGQDPSQGSLGTARNWL